MKRRQFIASLSISTLSISFFGKNEVLISREFEHDLYLPHDLLTILNNQQTIIEIGRGYREKNADENMVEVLIDRIASHKGRHRLVLKDGLRKKSTDDFKSGKTVQVQGWILSVTEARQCALYSILYS